MNRGSVQAYLFGKKKKGKYLKIRNKVLSLAATWEVGVTRGLNTKDLLYRNSFAFLCDFIFWHFFIYTFRMRIQVGIGTFSTSRKEHGSYSGFHTGQITYNTGQIIII